MIFPCSFNNEAYPCIPSSKVTAKGTLRFWSVFNTFPYNTKYGNNLNWLQTSPGDVSHMNTETKFVLVPRGHTE